MYYMYIYVCILCVLCVLCGVLLLSYRGDHSEQLAARWQRLGDEELGTKDEESEEEEETQQEQPKETSLQKS